MTARTKATINPALLVWARKTAGFALDAAAEKLGVDAERLAAWEDGDEAPSIPQLRKLAETYKRPLAVLYLPEPPRNFQAMHDFRRLPEAGPRQFSPELTLEIRLAHQRRSLALELFEETGDQPEPFTLKTDLDDDPEATGKKIRKALKIDYALQSKWREDRAAFIAWRSRTEELGVLVFQASRIETAEASGFAHWARVLPFIVVNRKDTYTRRAFSLLHELTHLMLHQSGVSDLDAEGPRPADDERVEVFCNHVAAASLMPREDLLAEPLVKARGPGRHEWQDDDIRALATIFSVSREALVRRLLILNRTTEGFYARKRAQYAAEFLENQRRQKEKNAGKNIARNMPRETLADYGRPFVRKVIENYHAERITISDVSGYLGVKARHIPGIEQQLGMD